MRTVGVALARRRRPQRRPRRWWGGGPRRHACRRLEDAGAGRRPSAPPTRRRTAARPRLRERNADGKGTTQEQLSPVAEVRGESAATAGVVTPAQLAVQD